MDAKLLAWGRSVKARRRARHPVLWLFTDAARLPDPLPAIAALPRGCGVVFRHDEDPDREKLGRAVAALCRRNGLILTVAGDRRLAAILKAGLHLRRGDMVRPFRGRWVTRSAHSLAELRRLRPVANEIVFLSPVFPTSSHPSARTLGVVRFAAWANRAKADRVMALGGVDGATCRTLPRRCCAGAGAITAFALQHL